MQVLRFDQLVNRSPQIEELCKCMICLDIFIDPICCENCENHFCQTCITTWSQNQPPRSCPICNKLKEKQGQRILKNMLNDLEFYCSYKLNGCGEILKYSEYFQHIKTCKYKQVKCLNIGCNKDILLKDMNEHDEICQFKLIKCKWCQADIIRQFLENHEKNFCNLRKILCNKCSASILFLQQKEHYEVCPENQYECDLCKKILQLKDKLQHNNFSCPNVELQCQGCQNLFKRSEMEQHKEQCQFIEIECQNCQQSMKRQDYHEHKLDKCFSNLRQIISDQQRQIKGLVHFCEELSQQINMLQQLQPTSKFSQTLKHKDIEISYSGKLASISFINNQEHKKIDKLVAIKNSKAKFLNIEFLNISDYTIYLGITNKINIQNPKDLQKLNHQSYFFCGNGTTYIHQNKDENGKKKMFGFGQGQKLELFYNDQFVKIKNYSTSQTLQYQISYEGFDKNDIDMIPVICLKNYQDRVRIMN